MTNEKIERIVDMYSDMMKRICFTYMKNEFEAEDIMQTVFLKLLKSGIAFHSLEHEKAWLIRVTVNCCKDNLKNFFRRNVSSIDEITEEDNITVSVQCNNQQNQQQMQNHIDETCQSRHYMNNHNGNGNGNANETTTHCEEHETISSTSCESQEQNGSTLHHQYGKNQ